jgi:hypothetical protein
MTEAEIIRQKNALVIAKTQAGHHLIILRNVGSDS